MLDAAQKIYWTDSNRYKAQRARDWLTGDGTYEDPFVVDPDFIRRSAKQQEDEMGPWLKKILETEGYADHPLQERLELYRFNNRGPLKKFSDRVKQGIASLRGYRRDRS